MGYHWNRQRSFARTISSFVAFLLLFQISLAGFAAAATGSQNQEIGFGAICQTQQNSVDDTQGDHKNSGNHHNGLCCVLHFDTIGTAQNKPTGYSVINNAEVRTLLPRFPESALETRLEPRSSPQAPRAPPAVVA